MESLPWVATLAAEAPIISPSLLACDFGQLQREVERVEAAGAKVLHVDVMDGHFVPNISIGVPVVASLRKVTKLPLDVHLMISEPERYLDAFRKAGADSLLVHIEVEPEPTRILKRIRNMGAAPGLVINPNTPVETVLPYLDLVDIMLVMSVEPGFGGQAFRPEVLEKVRTIREHLRPDALLSMDGGIGPGTIEQGSAAGANYFVAGTAVFGAPDYQERIASLRSEAESAAKTRERLSMVRQSS